MCLGESLPNSLDFFTKKSPKQQGKVVPYAFGREFLQFLALKKGHVGVSDEKLTALDVLRR